ncbi:MAG: hypothetical protein DPW09_22035 [Anaerolineae bacterium]|nr:hypothetical protein [Anaerolineales bacterium]MCQ3976117.1 hypothetical protein [Anaerolineae bacterium]
MSKILIYDDDEKWANDLKEKLKSLPILAKDFEIIALNQQVFTDSINTLEERRREVRDKGQWSGQSILLDEANILIIDYDLFDTNAFLTGEDIAYSARCFSTCGLIVALNQYYEVDFDLTLKGHPESFADLNIRGEQLSNPNLWGGDGEEFRPWYWPLLPKYQQDYELRIADVRQNLKQPICEVLGFDKDLFERLPRSINQFIGSSDDSKPSTTTFEDFVKKSGNGMRPKDSEKADEMILSRVGAARISKWLERSVFPELNILVDAPHLVSRYPSLLIGSKEEIESWNKTTILTDYTNLGLDIGKIENFRFQKNFWLSRPAWFWDKIRDCQDILEVREPWETFKPDWVFCEDISKFYRGDYQEFVAKVESPFARRFVKGINGIQYQPRVRFSL